MKISSRNFMHTIIKALSLCLLFSTILLADYNSDIQAGNAAYKSKNWQAAAEYYRKAYSVKPDSVLKKFLTAASVAAYKDALAKGNAYYKAGNSAEALKWYNTAYSYFQVKPLAAMITKLQGSPPQAIPAAAPASKSNPLQWVIIGGDAALAIGTVVAGALASSGVSEYNTLYDSTDNTNTDNYNALLDKKTSVEGTQTLFGALAVLTGAALVYTAADLFALHLVFPADTAVRVEQKGSNAALMLNREF